MSPANKTGPLLKRLRALMKNQTYVSEAIHAYIVPTKDAHQNEYIAANDKRREFISGFSGSAGTAIITEDKAALWTDGRYFLQATQQLDENWILVKEAVPNAKTKGVWLGETLPAGSRIGLDPFLFSADDWQTLSTELENNKQHLVAVNENLIDRIWDDRPVTPVNPVHIYAFGAKAQPIEHKLVQVRNKMNERRVQMLIVTALDEIAWLYNLRGSDIDYNPVFFSYAIVTMDSAYLFVDPNKLSPAVNSHLLKPESNYTITIHPYDSFVETFKEMTKQNSTKIWVSKHSSYRIHKLIPEARKYVGSSPIAELKAIKSPRELEGMKLANEYDAAALCEYFAWLEKEVPKGNVTEISGAEKLYQIRKQRESFVGLSFQTISSSGPSASIIHYAPSKETDRTLTMDEVYLCDSGGQYREGTTDITRTFHFSKASEYEKECFTRVLKGHIALMTAKFPEFTKGNHVDAFARKALWDVGLDYLHGTGHGIGAYLNVHEGPTGIGMRPYPDDPGLQRGMVLSNEPGYYEDNKFGFRIESAVVVILAETKFNGTRKFLTFEPLTFVPIQTSLIDPSFLTDSEISWLDQYHLQCREFIGNRLKQEGKMDAYEWLLRETQPLG